MTDMPTGATAPYPWFRRSLMDEALPIAASDVPTMDRRESEDPADYIPHADLSHAVNVALALGMPLLLTGEPGTGKTQLAYALAHDLGCPVHKFETKSTSASKDLFYSYDALSAFKIKDQTDPRHFIRYQALGLAILEAFPGDHPLLKPLLPSPVMVAPGSSDSQVSAAPSYVHPGAPRRAVVLIDEIDKAPRDFPNDLLNEIDRLTFRVPELQNAGSPGANGERDPPGNLIGVPAQYRPIMILTSNSEKGLPDPFLRRCVYFHISFPKPDEMAEIVAQRLKWIGKGDPLLSDVLDIFYKLRHDGKETRLAKEPSTAELLNWLQILHFRGVDRGQSLRLQPDIVSQTISTLLKGKKDRVDAEAFLKSWHSGKSA